MKVLNLYGTQNSGKTTAAKYVSAFLEMKGYSTHIVHNPSHPGEILISPEFAFGWTSYEMFKLRQMGDIIITDTPLLINSFYNKTTYLGENFDKVVLDTYKIYDNCNFLILRERELPHEQKSQEDCIGDQIETFLYEKGVPFLMGCGNDFYKFIGENTLKWLEDTENGNRKRN